MKHSRCLVAVAILLMAAFVFHMTAFAEPEDNWQYEDYSSDEGYYDTSFDDTAGGDGYVDTGEGYGDAGEGYSDAGEGYSDAGEGYGDGYSDAGSGTQYSGSESAAGTGDTYAEGGDNTQYDGTAGGETANTAGSEVTTEPAAAAVTPVTPAESPVSENTYNSETAGTTTEWGTSDVWVTDTTDNTTSGWGNTAYTTPTESAPVVREEATGAVTEYPAADTASSGDSSGSFQEEATSAIEEETTDTDVWQYEDYSYYRSTYDAFSGDANVEQQYEEVEREDSFYDEFVDNILAVIIKDEMTDEEKCRAVYDYVHSIPYVNVVYAKNWKENGYRMLHDRAGDCFGYYSASRLLLERLGYQVIELQNNNGFKHVWCLVSIDDGETWRHFDPTCWRWGSDGALCLLTDEEMTAYGTRHKVSWNQLSHDWDREQAAADIEECREHLKEMAEIAASMASTEAAEMAEMLNPVAEESAQTMSIH